LHVIPPAAAQQPHRADRRKKRAPAGEFRRSTACTASGHETTDTDPGLATSRGDYSLENYVLGQNRYQIELLANLDQVPEKGALAVVTFPKPLGGSGFPARVFAILP
jgi:kynurenine formamidase